MNITINNKKAMIQTSRKEIKMRWMIWFEFLLFLIYKRKIEMSNTLYFTRRNDPNLQQILIAMKFIGQEIKIQEINKKYDPLILLTS